MREKTYFPLVKSEDEIRAALSRELEPWGAQTRIAQALEVNPTTVMRWATGETAIPPAMQKLLRLYLFGEMPFGLIRDPGDVSTLLEFTAEEWQAIVVLATRAGQEPRAWIRSQILAYLAYRAADKTGSGAAPDPVPPAATESRIP